MEHDQSPSLPQALGGFFLGAFMAAGGLFFAYLATTALFERIAMDNWTAVPATLEKMALKKHKSRQSTSLREITTYNLQVRYSYQYEGASFTGTRINLLQLAENFTSYYQDLRTELKNNLKKQGGIRVWINPRDPEESIFKRSGPVFQVGILCSFAFVFATLGLGGLFMLPQYIVIRIFGSESGAFKAWSGFVAIIAAAVTLWIAVPPAYFTWQDFSKHGAHSTTWWLVLPGLILLFNAAPLFPALRRKKS